MKVLERMNYNPMSNSDRGASTADDIQNRKIHQKRSRIHQLQNQGPHHKQFDKNHFNNLIQRREFLTQRRECIRSTSWRRKGASLYPVATTTTTTTSNAEVSPKQIETCRDLNFEELKPSNLLRDSSAFRYGEGRERILESRSWHLRNRTHQVNNFQQDSRSQGMFLQNKKSNLLPSYYSSAYKSSVANLGCNSHSVERENVQKVGSPLKSIKTSTTHTSTDRRWQRQAESPSLASFSIIKADSNIRTALAELGSKYNIDRRQQDNKIMQSNVQSSSNNPTISKRYSFDLITAAGSFDSYDAGAIHSKGFQDDVSTALLTSTGTVSLEHTYNDLCSIPNSGSNEGNDQNCAFKKEEFNDCYSVVPRGLRLKKDDDNVNYLLQLNTLIGRTGARSSSSSPNQSKDCCDFVCDESASVESFHSSHDDIDICVELTAYDQDDTSILSPLSFDCAQSTSRSFDMLKNTRRGKSASQGSALFRWCGLLWIISLLLVYERSMNNEIYLISQHRRFLEDKFRESMRLVYKEVDHKLDFYKERSSELAAQTIVLMLDQWDSVRNRLFRDKGAFSSYVEHRTSQDLHNLFLHLRNPMIPSPLTKKVKAFENRTEKQLDDTIERRYHEKLRNEMAAEVNQLTEQIRPVDLHSQFYQDMEYCSDIPIHDGSQNGETFAIQFYFYSDITVCLNEKSFEKFHNEQTSALSYQFDRDMALCLDATVSNKVRGGQTLAIYYQFDRDMALCQDSGTIDKNQNRQTESLHHQFYQDVTLCSGESMFVMNNIIDTELNHHVDGQQIRNEDDTSENIYSEILVNDIASSSSNVESIDSMIKNDSRGEDYLPESEYRYFWSNQQPTKKVPFLSFKKKLAKPDMAIIEHSFNKPKKKGCFLSDVGLNPNIKDTSSLYCQYLVPFQKNETIRRNIAFEYLNAKNDVDEEMPMWDVLMDFFKVVRKSWKQRRREKKIAKQRRNRAKEAALQVIN